MRKVIAKLRKLEGRIAMEKGPFLFFALLLRDNSPNRWDLVVAAHWLKGIRREGLKYLSKQLLSALTREEFLLISAIFIVEPDDPRLKAIHDEFPPVEDGQLEINNETLFDMDMTKGYIITSRPLDIVQQRQAR